MTKCNCMAKNLSPDYHIFGCPVRQGIKFPTLFYYEKNYNCFVPAPDNITSIIVDAQNLNGETVDIRFKRIDLTDQELEKLLDILNIGETVGMRMENHDKLEKVVDKLEHRNRCIYESLDELFEKVEKELKKQKQRKK